MDTLKIPELALFNSHSSSSLRGSPRKTSFHNYKTDEFCNGLRPGGRYIAHTHNHGSNHTSYNNNDEDYDHLSYRARAIPPRIPSMPIQLPVYHAHRDTQPLIQQTVMSSINRRYKQTADNYLDKRSLLPIYEEPRYLQPLRLYDDAFKTRTLFHSHQYIGDRIGNAASCYCQAEQLDNSRKKKGVKGIRRSGSGSGSGSKSRSRSRGNSPSYYQRLGHTNGNFATINVDSSSNRNRYPEKSPYLNSNNYDTLAVPGPSINGNNKQTDLSIHKQELIRKDAYLGHTFRPKTPSDHVITKKQQQLQQEWHQNNEHEPNQNNQFTSEAHFYQIQPNHPHSQAHSRPHFQAQCHSPLQLHPTNPNRYQAQVQSSQSQHNQQSFIMNLQQNQSQYVNITNNTSNRIINNSTQNKHHSNTSNNHSSYHQHHHQNNNVAIQKNINVQQRNKVSSTVNNHVSGLISYGNTQHQQQHEQSEQQKRRQQQQNRKKVADMEMQTSDVNQRENKTTSMAGSFMEKVIKKAPAIMDKKNFQKALSDTHTDFFNVRLQESDQEQFRFDFSDLENTKDQYIEHSRRMLLKLNQLAEDRKEYTIISRLLAEKKQNDILWPLQAKVDC